MLACRCCLTFEDNLYSFDDYEAAFRECTGLVVEKTALICPSCIRKLNIAHTFREESLKSDAFLKSKHPEKADDVVVKVEPVDYDDEIASAWSDEKPVFKNEDVTSVPFVAPPKIEYNDDSDRWDASETEDMFFENIVFDANDDVIKEEPTKKRKRSTKKVERPASPGHSRRAKEAWEATKDNLIKDCPYCFKSGLTKSGLKRHIAVHVADHGGYECDICAKKFQKKQVLKQHLFTCHGFSTARSLSVQTTTLTCKECNEVVHGRRALRTHYRDNHPNKKLQETSSLGNYTCSECGRQLSSKNALELHEMTHTGLRPHICCTCGKGYRTKEHLRYHEMSHTGERPFVCPYADCDKGFKTKRTLQNHLPYHTGELNFPCEICGKRFWQEGLLKYHLHSHGGVPQYSCDVCDKKFKTAFCLKSHKRVHEENPKLNFSCDICGKRFKAPNLLKSHLILHDNHLRHSCEICGLKFRHSASWRMHKLTHSEERNFACGECGTQFKQKYTLKRHMCQHAKKLRLSDGTFELRDVGGRMEAFFINRNE